MKVVLMIYNKWGLLPASTVFDLQIKTLSSTTEMRGRTGLVVRVSDSGSGDPGSILSRVGVLFP